MTAVLIFLSLCWADWKQTNLIMKTIAEKQVTCEHVQQAPCWIEQVKICVVLLLLLLPVFQPGKNNRERTLSSEDWTATLLYFGVWRTQREQLSHDLKHMGKKDLHFVGKCTSSVSTASLSPGVLDQEQRQQLLITGPPLYERHNTVLLTFQKSWQGNRNFRAEKISVAASWN